MPRTELLQLQQLPMVVVMLLPAVTVAVSKSVVAMQQQQQQWRPTMETLAERRG
jgi:outer membrane biogenesis lipoprotein LolB